MWFLAYEISAKHFTHVTEIVSRLNCLRLLSHVKLTISTKQAIRLCMHVYVLYNLLWKYKKGHYHSQLFPPLLLFCAPTATVYLHLTY